MSVSEYLIRFTQQSRYATSDVDTEEKKQFCSINGLNDGLTYALESRDFLNFQALVDKALVLENRRGIIDEGITPLDTNDTSHLDIQGPITRARAQQLNLEVSSFLSKLLYVNIENIMLPNEYILIRNNGEDKERDGEGLRGGGDQQRRPNQVGGPHVKSN